MKRIQNYAISLALIAGTVALIGVPKVSALSYQGDTKVQPITNLLDIKTANYGTDLIEPPIVLKKETPKPKETKPDVKPAPVVELPKPVEYVVADGDYLTKIATEHGTTWQRIFYKNTQIANENVLNVGDKLIMPTPDEVLAERPITHLIPLQSQPETSSVAGVSSIAVSSSAGNGYDYGWCTYYAKNRRPDLPNNLGNANSWYYRASSMGLSTGSTPRVGAIGATGAGSMGHVVYIEAVNGNTVTVSEMNYVGFGVISTRTTSASEFRYIY